MARVTDRRRHSFFVVDNAVLDRHALSPHAVTIYAWLARFSDPHGRSFPSVPTLAERARMSKPTVRRALDELAAAGLVEVTRRAWAANDYQLLPVEESTSLTPPDDLAREESTTLTPQSTSLTGGVNDVDSNKTQLPIPNQQDDWLRVKEILRGQLTPDAWQMYIQPTRAVFDAGAQVIIVMSPNRYVYDWLTVRLHRVVRRAVDGVLPGWEVDYRDPG